MSIGASADGRSEDESEDERVRIDIAASLRLLRAHLLRTQI